MTTSLHQALWDHEKNALELGRLDLHGQPILCSPLEIFNRFSCNFREGETSSLAPSKINCEDLNPDLLIAFFKEIYNTASLQTRDVSSAINLLQGFIESTWADVTAASPLQIQANLEALTLNFKEFKRLRALHRHLLDQLERQIPLTPPTEPLSEDPNQLRLFSTESPQGESSDYDVWVVSSKVRKNQSLGLTGQLNEINHQLSVRRGVYEKIKVQDRIPLSIAITWDERPFIESVEAPIFGSEEQS